MNETNLLWEYGIDNAVIPSVSIGSTETVVDDYVRNVVKSVAKALRLNLRLEQQSYITSNKSDHWIIAFEENEKLGRIVGCNENKLPRTKYGEPYVTHENGFQVQIFNQTTEVFNYYGTYPVFGIGSTGREWSFYRLPLNSDSQQNLEDANLVSFNNTKHLYHCPLTGNVPSIQFDIDSAIESSNGEIQTKSKIELDSTIVYKWDDPEMLFVLGSVL